MNFTTDELKMLAESERLMDGGEMPYVNFHNQRLMVSEQAMAEFDLRIGQCISDAVFVALIRFEIADCKSQISRNKIH